MATDACAVVQIPLSGAGGFATVDADDFERECRVQFRNGLSWSGRICDVKWCGKDKGHTTYAVSILSSSLELRLHRAVMDARIGELIDHVDRDGRNNRRDNLRRADPQGNSANRRGNRDSSSRFKGVFLHRATGKFEAAIRIGGIKKHLGLFASESDAAFAYNLAAAEAFGKFALLNEMEAIA